MESPAEIGGKRKFKIIFTPKPDPASGPTSKPKSKESKSDECCRCGADVSLQRTLYSTVSSAGTKCCQLYLGNYLSYNCRTLSKEDKEQTLEYCEKHGCSFYVHCPLIANLAKVDSHDSVRVVSKELDNIADLPCACVLHVGKVGSIEQVAANIDDIITAGFIEHSSFERVPYKLLLETAAGQGSELGRNWEEMRHLYEGIDKTRIGICLDTQHAFAAGMCSFADHES